MGQFCPRTNLVSGSVLDARQHRAVASRTLGVSPLAQTTSSTLPHVSSSRRKPFSKSRKNRSVWATLRRSTASLWRCLPESMFATTTPWSSGARHSASSSARQNIKPRESIRNKLARKSRQISAPSQTTIFRPAAAMQHTAPLCSTGSGHTPNPIYLELR